MGQLIHEIATERGHEVVCIIDPNAQAQTLSPTLSLIGQGRDARCTVHNARCTMHDGEGRWSTYCKRKSPNAHLEK